MLANVIVYNTEHNTSPGRQVQSTFRNQNAGGNAFILIIAWRVS